MIESRGTVEKRRKRRKRRKRMIELRVRWEKE